MPMLEAREPISGHSVTKKLDRVRVSLGKSLGFYEMPTGVSVVMHTPMEIGEEIDAHDLLRVLGQSNRLTMPFVFRIKANLLRPKNIMTVGTDGYHETNMLQTFWMTHNQDVVVKPSSSMDELYYNDTQMPAGFPIPAPGTSQVVFEPLKMLL